MNGSYVQAVVDAIISRDRPGNVSLFDLGYVRVGTDDGWQLCDGGRQIVRTPPLPNNGTSFHAADGTPLVNSSRFSSMASMVAYSHAKGVKMDFYLLNCICMDEYTLQADPTWGQKVRDRTACRLRPPLTSHALSPGALATFVGCAAQCYAGDVQLLLEAGFDGVKIDNCGDDQGVGYVSRLKYLNASGKKLLIENSNQGFGNPWFQPQRRPAGPPRENPPNGTDWCPFHMFRSGGDIGATFGNILAKLQYARPYLVPSAPISRPGCWAFPDMLEVGNFPAGPLAFVESRTHFGAWCVVSSPLYLSTSLMDSAELDAIWPIISNREAIHVNQMWHGHPGRLVVEGTSGAHWQCWAKAGPSGSQAVLLLNAGTEPINATIPFEQLGLPCTDAPRSRHAATPPPDSRGGARRCNVRDIWAQADLAPTTGDAWQVHGLGAHDSRFVIFTPKASE